VNSGSQMLHTRHLLPLSRANGTDASLVTHRLESVTCAFPALRQRLHSPLSHIATTLLSNMHPAMRHYCILRRRGLAAAPMGAYVMYVLTMTGGATAIGITI